MALEGWYYLHTESNDLIYKREFGGLAADLRETPFAKMVWPFDPTDRAGAWRIVVEALACGAKKERVADLATKWGCDNADAQVYADYLGVRLGVDGDSWFATMSDFVNLQESPAGFGDTCLEALAELCKALDYRPAKMWGATFADLVTVSQCRKHEPWKR